jgi:uncharacterized protein YjbI with pentapeptide repeats
MDSKAFAQRWHDPTYVERVRGDLEGIFVRKTASGVDARGIVVGLDGAPVGFVDADLQGANLSSVDLSFAKLSCSMIRGAFLECRFDGALLDTCRMASSRFVACRFDGARLDSPWMDDAVFERCSFVGTTLAGRGAREYGGKRTAFEGCNFSNATLRNLTFRACRFVDCTFDGTVFRKLLLAGARFEKHAPTADRFADCEMQRVTVDGVEISVSS